MDRAAAVASSVGEVDPAGWLDRLEDLFGRVLAPAFVRREPRLRAWSYVLGLVSGLERKNGWTLAEHAGDATPDGMQRLLGAAAWDADDVRDRLIRYVAAGLGDPGGVLIADETGFLKSGRHSAGVQRQYTGTAGKITNCQVGVFLAYAVPGVGTRVLVDRELYIPKSWTEDAQRCGGAGIPEDAKFATKPQLAKTMVERAITAGLPFSWFTADEAYGGNGKLRDWLEKNKVAYVVAVACDTRVRAGAGRVIRADHLAVKVPAGGWHRMSCGPGSKGERLSDWALADAGDGRQLLIRRSLSGGELAYYLCWSPRHATLAELVKTAGARWAVEECFQAAKNETALDHYQARKHIAWYRHITLAMCAAAWLAVCADGGRPPPAAGSGRGPGTGDRAREGAASLWTTFPAPPRQSRQSGHHRAGMPPHGERDPAAARHLLPSRASAQPSPALVAVAARASGPRPALPLPAAAAAAMKPALPGPACRLASGPPRRDDPGMTTAAQPPAPPDRHVLALPGECDCGMCTPGWMRRRGKQKRYSEPVSLADAMEREDRAAWPVMVAQHAACLIALTSAAARAVADEPEAELGAPEVGLPVLMFAGELAAVLQPGEHRDQLPDSLVAASEQAVTTATLTAAGCLAGLVDAIQAVSALAS